MRKAARARPSRLISVPSGNLEDVGGLLVGQAFESDEQQGFLLLQWQRVDGAGHFGQRDMARLRRRGR